MNSDSDRYLVDLHTKGVGLVIPSLRLPDALAASFDYLFDGAPNSINSPTSSHCQVMRHVILVLINDVICIVGKRLESGESEFARNSRFWWSESCRIATGLLKWEPCSVEFQCG